jgi:hypothetical protein
MGWRVNECGEEKRAKEPGFPNMGQRKQPDDPYRHRGGQPIVRFVNYGKTELKTIGWGSV